MCSDCSENLYEIKTIKNTTPKKNWGSGDFLHIFWAYKLLVTFPLNYIKKFQEKSKKSQKISKKSPNMKILILPQNVIFRWDYV